jgi:hypothetical protein
LQGEESDGLVRLFSSSAMSPVKITAPGFANRPRLSRLMSPAESGDDDLALETLLDGAVDLSVVAAISPAVLYHYTTWDGAKGILGSGEFRASAHHCTNDDAEIRTANETIVDVARQLRTRTRGEPRQIVDRFISGYGRGRALADFLTVYLACFSVARDHPGQWQKYGDSGRGVCLGVRVINEPAPELVGEGTKLIRVDYSEASWRETVDSGFRSILTTLIVRNSRGDEKIRAVALAGLYRIAAFTSIAAKGENWASEQEYRRVTLVHPKSGIRPIKRSDGKEYLSLPVRANGKRIALKEILIGPAVNEEHGIVQAKTLLNEVGYRTQDFEYPEHIFPSEWGTNFAAREFGKR